MTEHNCCEIDRNLTVKGLFLLFNWKSTWFFQCRTVLYLRNGRLKPLPKYASCITSRWEKNVPLPGLALGCSKWSQGVSPACRDWLEVTARLSWCRSFSYEIVVQQKFFVTLRFLFWLFKKYTKQNCIIICFFESSTNPPSLQVQRPAGLQIQGGFGCSLSARQATNWKRPIQKSH